MNGRLSPATPSDRTVDVAVAAVTASLLVAVGAGLGGPVRALLAIGFMTFAPGWALMDHLRLAHGPDKVALAVVTSLTSCALASLGSLWLGLWHPAAVFGGLALLTLTGIATNLEEGAR